MSNAIHVAHVLDPHGCANVEPSDEYLLVAEAAAERARARSLTRDEWLAEAQEALRVAAERDRLDATECAALSAELRDSSSELAAAVAAAHAEREPPAGAALRLVAWVVRRRPAALERAARDEAGRAAAEARVRSWFGRA